MIIKRCREPWEKMAIDEAMAILTNEERMAFEMRFYHCASLKEIAVACGYPKSWRYGEKLLNACHKKFENLYSDVP